MTNGFKDYFSVSSENYRQYRPQYPAELFAYLASLTPANDLAWDCATGTGQAAQGLAKFFRQVVATDPSHAQIDHAEQSNGIQYRVETAERSSLETGSADIIAVSQALHWFRISDFFKEADRVLKFGGILAVWTYGFLSVAENVDEIIFHFYEQTLDGYWPPERSLVENGYQEIRFPFQSLSPPAFEIKTEWNLHELMGYLSTWSAVKKYESANGVSPIASLRNEIAQHWGNPGVKRMVKWPLKLIIRKKIP